MSWIERAACNQPDVEPSWFDVSEQGMRPIEALRICRGCPVRLNCLAEALGRPSSDDSGVWGGTTHRNRREVRAGRMTAGRAMGLGDRLANQPTTEEAYERKVRA